MSDLISRAAVIKKFAEKREVWYGNGPLPSNESLMWQAAMSITEDLPAVDAMPVVQRWIDTKDRLPADRGRYLVMLKTDGKIGFEVHEHLMRILYFGSEGWRLPRHYPEWIHEALKQEVTHWMPLPEPPKMDGDT